MTTLVGGLLGAHFQRRNWDHQNERALAEADRNHATQTCRELSQLMDKRLYRMLLVRWAVFADQPDVNKLEARMEDYRAVLLEWNDSLMRNLAAAEIMFGSNVRNHLEGEVYERFKAAGSMLEVRYGRVRSPSEQTARPTIEEVATVDTALGVLRSHIYQLNVRMLEQIRDGRVGRSTLEPDEHER